MSVNYKCSIKYINEDEIIEILNNIEQIANENNSESYAKKIIRIKPYINRAAKELFITPNKLFFEWVKYHNSIK